MKTTLNKIKAHSPCKYGWKKLLKNLGKTKADDEPLELSTILESNGLDDALWCLQAVDGYKKELRLFAVECARSVQHLMKDQRSIDSLDVAERCAKGTATYAELSAARAAIRFSAWDAAWAATWTEERDAARFSARVSARAVALAAGDAAGDDARNAQSILFLLMCEGAFE